MADVVIVAQAAELVQAQLWVSALRDAGIEAATFERGVGAALGGATAVGATYPVLVQRRDLVAARNVIAEMGGAPALAPLAEPETARSARARAAATVGLVAVAGALAALIARLIAR